MILLSAQTLYQCQCHVSHESEYDTPRPQTYETQRVQSGGSIKLSQPSPISKSLNRVEYGLNLWKPRSDHVGYRPTEW
jgi:hypothetical protein